MVPLVIQDAAAGTLPVISSCLLGAAICWFVVCGVVLLRTDVREHRLPNRWTAALWCGGLVLLLGATLSAPETSSLTDRWHLTLLGSAGYTALMVVLHVATRGGLGMGDVKLAAGLGLYGGFMGPEALLGVMVLAFVLGGLQALYLVLLRGATKTTRIAFGPAMIIGCAPVLIV